MKVSAVVLAGSLLANAVMIGWLIRVDSAAGRATVMAAAAAKKNRVATPSPPQAKPADLLALEPGALRTKLGELGFPPDLVSHLVAARIDARHRERANELVAEALKTAPPWRIAAMRTDRLSILTPEQRKELRDLEADARNEILRLLGPAHLDRTGLVAFKYAFVSPERAVLLDALVKDYENLAAQLKDDTRYLRTPADREREKFLRDEQDRDLAALLTPEEREMFELRASTTAQNASFQSRIAAFQPNEAEYRTLFALQKAADERRQSDTPPSSPGIRGAPGATMMTIYSGSDLPEEAARSALGEARFADWQLAGASHYQSLLRLAERQNIPLPTVKHVAGVLNDTMDTSWRIAGDDTMDVPQKKAALQSLSDATRAQLAASLGPAVASSYLKSIRWFDYLAAGQAVKVSANVTSMRSVDRPVVSTPRPSSPTK